MRMKKTVGGVSRAFSSWKEGVRRLGLVRTRVFCSCSEMWLKKGGWRARSTAHPWSSLHLHSNSGWDGKQATGSVLKDAYGSSVGMMIGVWDCSLHKTELTVCRSLATGDSANATSDRVRMDTWATEKMEGKEARWERWVKVGRRSMGCVVSS